MEVLDGSGAEQRELREGDRTGQKISRVFLGVRKGSGMEAIFS